MILQLHFDILSVEVGISAILPFSCFLVHHAEKPRLGRGEKIEYAETEVDFEEFKNLEEFKALCFMHFWKILNF